MKQDTNWPMGKKIHVCVCVQERESIEETEQGIKREEEKKNDGGGMCCDGKRRSSILPLTIPHFFHTLSHKERKVWKQNSPVVFGLSSTAASAACS